MALTEVPIELSSTPGIVDNSTGTAITIDTSGNVGIGESSPSEKISIAKGISYNTDSALFTTIGVNDGAVNNNAVYRWRTGITGSATGHSYTFSTLARAEGSYTERMRITSSGALQLADVNSPNDLNCSIFSNSDVLELEAFGTNGAIAFSTGSSVTERMRIDSSGNVGIGTSSPGSSTNYNTLTINGTTGGIVEFHSGGSLQSYILGNSSELRMQSQSTQPLTFNTNGTERMRIDSSGNLLVGTQSDPVGSERIRISVTSGTINGICAAATTTAGGVALSNRNSSDTYVGGVSFTNTATSFPTSSDQRLKENIVDAPSASDDIDAIQVRSFDWKADGSHQKYGMVAQELLTVAPEAVSAPEDPEEMMGVDYSKLVPMLVKEVQQLRARVAQLESK